MNNKTITHISEKAEKVKLQIATDERYIAQTKKKISSISNDDIKRGNDYVKKLLET